MKKVFTLFAIILLSCVFVSEIKAQYVTITDTEFRSFLKAKYPLCFNASDQMDTTCTQIITEDAIDFPDPFEDIDGIQYFDGLRYLKVGGAAFYGIRTLNYGHGLPAGLKKLDVSFNYFNSISSIGPLPDGLDTLLVNGQRDVAMTPTPYDYPCFGSLAGLNPNLKYLDCSNNALGSIDNLPNTLTWLNCSNNYTITGFPGPDPAVFTLSVIQNLPASLVYLNCSKNALTTLPPLPVSLKYLNCSYNPLSSSPTLPSTLEYLNVYGPDIVLPTIFPTTLLDLIAYKIQPNSQLPASLAYLEVGPEQGCLPLLPASMSGQSPYNNYAYNMVFVGATSGPGHPVTCLPNYITGIRVGIRWSDLSLHAFTLPTCNLVNNLYGCQFNPAISGYVFYDNNSNGIPDPGELPRSGVKVILDNSLVAFTDNSGYYGEYGHIGNNILTVESPTYYNAVPSSFNYNFNTIDTTVIDTVALQPNQFVDSVRITITPLGPARPGRELSYHINYENVGTTSVNPAITINFDNSKLTYSFSTGAIPVAAVSTLSLAPGVLTPGQRSDFNSTFWVHPAVLAGSFINTSAVVVAGTATCIDSTTSIVTASYDPNEKLATPALSATQVQSGKEIDYIIRFQNTGTDTAFNILVTDTLSSMLIANTFKMIEATHNCRVTQLNENINFEFNNILLPDSNVNEPASHGYIRFRIKPQTSLPDNTVVPNNVSIYFDFNAPVVTNTATTIVNLVPVPVKLNSFNVKKQNSVVQLYWTTEQELNSKSFIIERSGDQRSWNEVTRLHAAGNSSSTRNYSATDLNPVKGINYYWLKQVDLDNKTSYSEIRSVYFSNTGGIFLAPNPTKDNVNVYLPYNPKPLTVILCNLNGETIKKMISNDTVVQINVSGLPKGMYMIKVEGEKIHEIKKLLVQ